MTDLSRPPSFRTLLSRVIDSPELVRAVRALPVQAFSELVRQVGVEDAGELVALATVEQLLAAFDEDLFANSEPGEREVFDPRRFLTWLEVLLEAGEAQAAERMAALSEDFVVHAFSSAVLVLDCHALSARMQEDDPYADVADKLLESALSEEIDGYLLVARVEDGWDALLTLVLALDRDHRAFLTRVLDRCAALASEYIDDLEALSELLSSADSLAEDVEAEREERRSRLGFVEPRAARSFLSLARMPLSAGAAADARDIVTKAHLRQLAPSGAGPSAPPDADDGLRHALESARVAPPLAISSDSALQGDPTDYLAGPIAAALRDLGAERPDLFAARMEELAYLANVLLAGAAVGGRRLRPVEAAEAAVATVALGAEIEALSRRGDSAPASTPAAAVDELRAALEECPADLLFRRASSTLVGREPAAESVGFVRSRRELQQLLESAFLFARRR